MTLSSFPSSRTAWGILDRGSSEDISSEHTFPINVIMCTSVHSCCKWLTCWAGLPADYWGNQSLHASPFFSFRHLRNPTYFSMGVTHLSLFYVHLFAFNEHIGDHWQTLVSICSTSFPVSLFSQIAEYPSVHHHTCGHTHTMLHPTGDLWDTVPTPIAPILSYPGVSEGAALEVDYTSEILINKPTQWHQVKASPGNFWFSVDLLEHSVLHIFYTFQLRYNKCFLCCDTYNLIFL